jgi:hypothetical protein
MTPEQSLSTAGTLNSAQLSDIQWALDRFIALSTAYTHARNYYDGNHDLAFASKKMNEAFGKLLRKFTNNLMPTVAETVKDRLKLEGFTATGASDSGDSNNDASQQPALQKSLDEVWRRNRLTVRANEVHLDALIDGDSYLIVWPDREGVATFYPNRGSAIVTEYDDEQPGYIIRAAKAYEKDKRCYLTLYFRDRLEKYVTREKVQGVLPDRASTFIPLQVQGEPWPLPNSYDKVPVFHFGNRTGIGCLGISELREAIPVQDALNKSIADMLVASEFYGFPQRWATGLDEAEGMTTEQIKQRYGIVAGGLWGSTSEKAAFGTFAQADISKYIDIKEGFKKDIALVSRTPLHFFQLHGTPPSGESLRVAESPLMAKVQDKMDAWGGVWADAMRFALIVSGKGEHEPEPKWANTQTRDETGEVERAATKHRELKVPTEVLWRELGYTEQQIKEMSKLAEQEAKEEIERQREQFAMKAGVVAKGQVNGDAEVLQ